MHLLIFLEPQDKITMVEQIDAISLHKFLTLKHIPNFTQLFPNTCFMDLHPPEVFGKQYLQKVVSQGLYQ